jgi:hypothetical protein
MHTKKEQSPSVHSIPSLEYRLETIPDSFILN